MDNKCRENSNHEGRGIQKLPLRAVIIKSVGNSCNLRCGYCFYSGHGQTMNHIMSSDLIEKLIREYLQYSPRKAYFIWHGGEPLLAGISFFERVIELQNNYRKEGQIIKNAIQTNGTLINEKWALFFKNHNFRVGVSLDGAEKTHNLFRRDTRGRDTFKKVIAGVKILREYGIEPGIISVLFKSSLNYLEKNFGFLIKELHIRSWSINIYYDNNSQSQIKYESVNNKDFEEYYINLIDLWLSHNSSDVKIREIDAFGAAFFGKIPSLAVLMVHVVILFV